MQRISRYAVLLAGITTLLLAGCAASRADNGDSSAAAQTPTMPAAGSVLGSPGVLGLPAEERQHEGGGITVKIKPAGQRDGQLRFDVVLDTHSVELSYDLVSLASLKDEQGRAYRATSWQGGQGGHHIEGVLAFEAPESGVSTLALELRDIGGVPSRTFRWDVR